MNIEQAIAELFELNSEKQITGSTFAACVDALREKAERDKGCEYCNDPDMEYGAVSFPRTENGKVSVMDMEAVAANYCPICGGQLEDHEPKEAR